MDTNENDYKIQLNGKGAGAFPRPLCNVSIMTHAIKAGDGLLRKEWLNLSGDIGKIENLFLYDVTKKGEMNNVASATFTPIFENVDASRIHKSENTNESYERVKSLRIGVKIGDGKAELISNPKHEKDSGSYDEKTNAHHKGDTVWPITKKGDIVTDERLWIESAMKAIFAKTLPNYTYQRSSSKNAQEVQSLNANVASLESNIRELIEANKKLAAQLEAQKA